MFRQLCFFVILCLSNCLLAQKNPTIIINPSFEGIPQMDAKNIEGWLPFNQGSTPDILPGPWGVTLPAFNGKTYMGLTVRSDNTWEAAVQQLNAPLRKDYCYNFSIALALSDTYAGYNNPARLRIWGSNSPNSLQDAQLLNITPSIAHKDWKVYQLSFIPDKNWSYIIIECYYKEATLLPYKGNILIDAWSDFIPCERA